MDKRAASARREDVSRVVHSVLGYIPNLTKPLKLRKPDRGWFNEVTARLLCPQNLLNQFNDNWNQ